jgi:hypothetical protein
MYHTYVFTTRMYLHEVYTIYHGLNNQYSKYMEIYWLFVVEYSLCSR